MATVRQFEDLLCWKKSRLLVKSAYGALGPCKDYGFKDQIQRASVSVLSNIAEGFESGTKQGFVNYLYIAKASAGEVRAQLYVALDVGYINTETFQDLKGRAEECSKLISSFAKRLKADGAVGLQYKREKAKDPVDEILRKAGKAMTKEGLMDIEEASKRGLI